MKTCTKYGVEKEVGEFHKDKSRRDGLFPHCKRCAIANACAWQKANPEKRALVKAKWQKANLAKGAQATKKWMAVHGAALLARTHAARMAYSAARKKLHPEQVNHHTALRRAAKRNATPAWANKFFIEEIYDLAQRRSRCKTGGFAEWHVDHIVPLKHPLVQGLHVEHNLRVIPAVVNIAKGNKHQTDALVPQQSHI